MNNYDNNYAYLPQGDAQANYYNQCGAYPAGQYSQAGYAQYPGYPVYQQPAQGGWFDFKNPSYIKGMLIAAGVTLLMANPNVQKSLLKGVAQTWSSLQYGVEEVKEQINDIKAEMQFKKEQKAADQEETGDA